MESGTGQQLCFTTHSRRGAQMPPQRHVPCQCQASQNTLLGQACTTALPVSPDPRRQSIQGHLPQKTMDIQHNCTRVKAPDCSQLVSSPASFFPGAVLTDATQSQQNANSTTHDSVTLIQSVRRRQKFLDLRGGLCLATWNVSTLSETGYQTALSQLQKLQISVAGISKA